MTRDSVKYHSLCPPLLPQIRKYYLRSQGDSGVGKVESTHHIYCFTIYSFLWPCISKSDSRWQQDQNRMEDNIHIGKRQNESRPSLEARCVCARACVCTNRCYGIFAFVSFLFSFNCTQLIWLLGVRILSTQQCGTCDRHHLSKSLTLRIC